MYADGVRGEIRHGPGHLVGCSALFEGNAVGLGGLDRVGQDGGHIRFDEPRGTALTVMPRGASSQGGGLGQSDEAGLGGQ
jgi:hypothetical protein